MPILRGKELISAVRSTKRDIRVALRGAVGVPLIVPAPAALQLMRVGHWEGRVRGERVCVLRELAPPPDPRPFVKDTHRWDDRAVIRFWADQGSANGRWA